MLVISVIFALYVGHFPGKSFDRQQYILRQICDKIIFFEKMCLKRLLNPKVTKEVWVSG